MNRISIERSTKLIFASFFSFFSFHVAECSCSNTPLPNTPLECICTAEICNPFAINRVNIVGREGVCVCVRQYVLDKPWATETGGKRREREEADRKSIQTTQNGAK